MIEEGDEDEEEADVEEEDDVGGAWVDEDADGVRCSSLLSAPAPLLFPPLLPRFSSPAPTVAAPARITLGMREADIGFTFSVSWMLKGSSDSGCCCCWCRCCCADCSG